MCNLDIQLLLLSGQLAEIAENVLDDCVNVLTTLLGIDGIHKADMLLLGGVLLVIKESPSQNSGNFPAVRAALMCKDCVILDEETDKLLKGVCTDSLTIPADLDILACKSGELKSSGVKNESHLVNVQTDEAAEVRLIHDADETLGCILLDGGLVAGEHVVAPCLRVLESVLRRASLNREGVREDVGELGAIAVLAADNLLLFLVVVSAGQEMSENHLGYIDLLSRMHLNRNTVAVILYTDGYTCGVLLHTDLNVLDRSLTCLPTPNKSIPSIYDNLIKELVETRVERAVAVDHLTLRSIKDPSHLIVCLN